VTGKQHLVFTVICRKRAEVPGRSQPAMK